MFWRPAPVACTAAGSAVSLPTLIENGDPGMWTPLNLTWILWIPFSLGMNLIEYSSKSITWTKQSSSKPDGPIIFKESKHRIALFINFLCNYLGVKIALSSVFTHDKLGWFVGLHTAVWELSYFQQMGITDSRRYVDFEWRIRHVFVVEF